MDDRDGKAEARAEAAHWYARLKTLPVSLATLRDFYAWRRLPGNADAFLAVDDVHDTTGQLADSASIQAATEAAYQRGFDRRRASQGGRRRFAWAAGLAVLLLAGGAFLMPRSSHERSVSTRLGEQREVALEDGSIVHLDTDSALSTHFTRAARHVQLVRGQAYFTVAHDADLPFVVDAGSVSVTATGTQFDVRRSGSQTDVTLVQGGVDIRSGGSISRLSPGQSLRILPGRKPMLHSVDTGLTTAWTHGRLVLDGVSLAHAIDEVNRYTDRPVRLDNRAYADAKFSGSLTTGDVRGFVAAVTAMLPLRAVTDQAGSVHLVGVDGSIERPGLGRSMAGSE